MEGVSRRRGRRVRRVVVDMVKALSYYIGVDVMSMSCSGCLREGREANR